MKELSSAGDTIPSDRTRPHPPLQTTNLTAIFFVLSAALTETSAASSPESAIPVSQAAGITAAAITASANKALKFFILYSPLAVFAAIFY